MLAILGRSWASVCALGAAVCGRAALGAYVGGLRPLLGRILAVFGRSWGLYVAEKCEEHSFFEDMLPSPAGARSEASGCGLGLLLGLMLVVLGRSWSLCWRSWAAFGAYIRNLRVFVGCLRSLLRLVLVVLAALGAHLGSPWRPWAEK